MQTRTNFETVRNGGRPAQQNGAHYIGLIATPPASFSDEKRRAFAVQVALANAALLDLPLAPGAGEEMRTSTVAAAVARMDRPEFREHVRAEVFLRLPLVTVNGPTDDFQVDMNGTPLTRDGYAAYSTGNGSIFVESVNLPEYREHYELSQQDLAGSEIAPLDLEWTTTKGDIEPAEQEIRDNGLIAEALKAAKAGDLERFDKLAAKSSGKVNGEGFTLSKKLSDLGEEWADRARERALENGHIPAIGL